MPSEEQELFWQNVAELIAYEDLGAEALRKLYVEDMPLVVIIDSEGNNLYEEGRAEYLKGKKN